MRCPYVQPGTDPRLPGEVVQVCSAVQSPIDISPGDGCLRDRRCGRYDTPTSCRLYWRGQALAAVDMVREEAK